MRCARGLFPLEGVARGCCLRGCCVRGCCVRGCCVRECCLRVLFAQVLFARVMHRCIIDSILQGCCLVGPPPASPHAWYCRSFINSTLLSSSIRLRVLCCKRYVHGSTAHNQRWRVHTVSREARAHTRRGAPNYGADAVRGSDASGKQRAHTTHAKKGEGISHTTSGDVSRGVLSF